MADRSGTCATAAAVLELGVEEQFGAHIFPGEEGFAGVSGEGCFEFAGVFEVFNALSKELEFGGQTFEGE